MEEGSSRPVARRSGAAAGTPKGIITNTAMAVTAADRAEGV
jgi:hypothetical protein